MKPARVLGVMFVAAAAVWMGGCSNLPGGSSCEPASCASAGAQCGSVSDGCGGTLNCGACPAGGVCGAVAANQCCAPRACTAGVSCGLMDDGCGGTVACGECTAPQTCGAAGQANVCGCVPRNDCALTGAVCGDLPDGCGGTTSCGTCTAPQTCGGGGAAGQCGCIPITSCSAAGAECGTLSNGCGGTVTCPVTECPLPTTCGGGGTPNRCGCTPITCEGTGIQCGTVPDGCGGMLTCQGCTLPETCGGAGSALVCGCTPRACPAGLNCGQVPDGCGGFAACGGNCGAGQVCGGNGADNVCAPVAAQLVNVHPRVVGPGATLHLEGSFVAPVTVNFPGGTTATADVLGLRRARVTVPLNAVSGPVSVTTAGTTTAAFAVTVVPYQLGLTPFAPLNAQTSVATQATRLLTPRDHHQAVAVGRWVYLLGGRGTGGALQSVERALVHDDGTVGPFADAGVQLSSARERFGVVLLGAHLYVLGGTGSAGLLRSVERAAINADGTLGAFATVAGVELAAGRRDFGVEVLGNYVHVVGGAGDDGPVAATERAQVRPDGSLTTFVVTGSPLVTGRTTHRTVVAGDALYVLGGLDGSGGALGSVERAVIQPDGSLGAFAVDPVALVTPRFDLAATVVDGSLYVVGGRGAAGVLGSVERADVTDTGLGAFQVETSSALFQPRHGHVALAQGHRMLVLGGKDTTGPLAAVEAALLMGNGALDPWATVQGVALNTARYRHASVVVHNRLYVLGGEDAAGNTLNTVEVSVLGPDGLPGPFTAAPVTLVTPRRGARALLSANRLYLVAGENGGTPLQNLEYATVGPDGALSAFTTLPNIALLNARADFAAFATPRGLFVAGGRQGNTVLSSVERSPINAQGALGPFENVAAAALTPARAFSGVVVVGAQVHLLGGADAAGAPLNLHSVSAIQPTTGDLAPWTTHTPLTSARRAPAVLHSGPLVHVVGGHDGTTALRSVESAPVTEALTVGDWVVDPTLQLVTGRESAGLLGGAPALVVGGKSTVPLATVERGPIR